MTLVVLGFPWSQFGDLSPFPSRRHLFMNIEHAYIENGGVGSHYESMTNSVIPKLFTVNQARGGTGGDIKFIIRTHLRLDFIRSCPRLIPALTGLLSLSVPFRGSPLPAAHGYDFDSGVPLTGCLAKTGSQAWAVHGVSSNQKLYMRYFPQVVRSR